MFVIWFETQNRGTTSTLDKVRERSRVSAVQTGDARGRENSLQEALSVTVSIRLGGESVVATSAELVEEILLDDQDTLLSTATPAHHLDEVATLSVEGMCKSAMNGRNSNRRPDILSSAPQLMRLDLGGGTLSTLPSQLDRGS